MAKEINQQGNPPDLFDAIILAGDRKASRKVKGKNKALLTFGGKPVISYVLSGLIQSRYVKDIFIVGPKEQLEKALAADIARIKGRKITILQQWDNLFENVWNSFLHTIPGYKPGIDPESYRNTPYYHKAILVLPGDIPLLAPFEVDEFIENCAYNEYDYMPGITPDFSLIPYYPNDKRKGIKHAYFHFREGRFRQNNLHFGKLFLVRNKKYVEKMYEHRHQREWKDIVSLAFEILRTEKGSYKSLIYFILLQVSMMLTSVGLVFFSDQVRKLVGLTEMEEIIGILMGTKMKTAPTYYGGAALDIDSDEEFDAVKDNYEDWMAYQRELYESREKK